MQIEEEDAICWYRSAATGKEFPEYIFGGDTDMATEGKVSLTSLDRLEVVITMTTSREMANDDYYNVCAQRINRIMERDDLRCIPLVEIPPRDGERFPTYRRGDIFSPGGEVERIGAESVSAFIKRGGSVLVLEEDGSLSKA